jgi:hypothetical protein
MKPFITPERLTSGKLRFPFQCEGIRPEALVDRVKAYRLMAYAVPEGQSAAEAWYLDLRFEDGERLEIMSASTALPNWQEFGSLSWKWANEGAKLPEMRLIVVGIEPRKVTAVEKIVFEDDEVVVECGLAFSAENERDEILIESGVSPGAVSMRAPFVAMEFRPQFPIAMCKRVGL